MKLQMTEEEARDVYRVGCQDDLYCIADENDFIQNLKRSGYITRPIWEEAEEILHRWRNNGAMPDNVEMQIVVMGFNAIKKKAGIK
jgi:hypothetical protein